MANPDRARKLLIRTALATSSTIATLFGAQNLALLDGTTFQQVEAVTTTTITADTTALTIEQAEPSLVIQKTAPNFVILRHATNGTNSANTQPPSQNQNVNTRNIQPPIPSQMAAPAPIIVQQAGQTVYVQQPAPQITESSK